ncbi:MAG: hypothetical protein ACM3NT_05430 [Methylocystaceae bacterium]
MPRIGFIRFPYFLASVLRRHKSEYRSSPLLIHLDNQIVGTSEDLPFQLQGSSLNLARSKCPHAQCVPYDHELFDRAHKQCLEILAAISPLIEPVTEGQYYFDLSGCSVRNEIQNLKKLLSGQGFGAVIVGLGSTKLISYLAVCLSANKLKELTYAEISSENNPSFLAGIPLRHDPSIQPRTKKKLNALGYQTFADIQELSLSELTKLTSRDDAYILYQHSRGQDSNPLVGLYPPERISCQFGFGGGSTDGMLLSQSLQKGAQIIDKQLKERQQGGNLVTLSVQGEKGKYELGRHLASSRSIGDVFSILLAAMKIKEPIHSLILSVSQLYDLVYQEQDLFDMAHQSQQNLNDVIAALKAKYPDLIINYNLQLKRREQVLSLFDPLRG